jgi:hypothetical protein
MSLCGEWVVLEVTPGQKAWWQKEWWQTGCAGGHSWAEGVVADGVCWRSLLGRRSGEKVNTFLVFYPMPEISDFQRRLRISKSEQKYPVKITLEYTH